MNLQRNAWLPFCCLFTNVFGAPTASITLSLEKSKIVNIVDQRFLSFTIDSHNLMKGWKSFDLTNQRIIELTKHLFPAYLRIGGTDADLIEFAPVIDETVADSGGETTNDTVLVPGSDFLLLANFVNQTKVDLIYGLNVLLRSKETGQWNSSNTISLLNFLSAHHVKIFGFELGNEPDSFYHVFNTTVASPKLASDFNTLKSIMNQYKLYSKASIMGPDVTRPTGKRSRALRYLKGFLKHVGKNVVDTVTFHQYYFSGKNSTVNDFVNTTIMDVLGTEIKRVKFAVSKYLPGKPIWIGETASAWGGGSANISDRYASSFLWIDKLGLAARLGVQAVFRQTLIGGNYGLLNVDGYPTPNYFVSVLHKRLVGQSVLDIDLFPEMSSSYHTRSSINFIPGLRLYAQCTAPATIVNGSTVPQGSVTVFGVNVETVTVIIKLYTEGKIIYEYLMQAPDLTSSDLYLNGVKLAVDKNGNLPSMPPIVKRKYFVFPKLTLGFWVLPYANNSNCFTK